MRLYLLRHGPAEPGHWGQPDHERVLTPAGLTLMQRVATTLGRLAPAADCLIASPYRRAVQTASMVSDAVGCSVTTEAVLRPGGTLEDLAEVVSRYDGCQQVWVVAHQPSLGAWTYALTGARAAIQPGTLVVLEARRLRPEAGVLQGIYAPEWLAGMAGPAGSEKNMTAGA